jgi:hypothetical protein
MNHKSKSSSGMRHLTIYINTEYYSKFKEIAHLENIPQERLLENMISAYVPTPAVLQEGEFRCIDIHEVTTLQKLHPFAAVVSVGRNSKIGIDEEIRKQWRDEKISWDELKRKYIERLNMPDAREEIERLRQLKKTQDIYITSFERFEEFSMRKLFIDYVNGKLIWK